MYLEIQIEIEVFHNTYVLWKNYGKCKKYQKTCVLNCLLFLNRNNNSSVTSLLITSKWQKPLSSKSRYNIIVFPSIKIRNINACK